jgi:hypothetical protein
MRASHVERGQVIGGPLGQAPGIDALLAQRLFVTL